MKTLKEYIDETIRRYGPVGNNRGVGFTVSEDEEAEADAEDAPEQPEQDADHNDPLLTKAIADAPVGAMEESIDELNLILDRAKLRD